MTATDNQAKSPIPDAQPKAGPRRLLVLLPLAVFLGLALLFLIRLGAGDVSRIPSALIGRPAPATDLPPVAGLARAGQPVPGLETAAFKGMCRQVWASVRALRDRSAAAAAACDRQAGPSSASTQGHARKREFLARYGNPYAATGADSNGAPRSNGASTEARTSVVGRDAKIAYKLIGPITPQNPTPGSSARSTRRCRRRIVLRPIYESLQLQPDHRRPSMRQIMPR
jgi:cytochrome c biogenesis protein CcmG/thiol:disulfide interchange protein DsbE